MTTPLLTRRAVLLVAMETTYGTQATTSPSTDAVLVSAPDFSVNVKLLERANVRPSFSKFPVIIGRKLGSFKFTTELRSNGKTNAGTLGSATILGRLLRGCGFSETATAASRTGAVYQGGAAGITPSWANGGTLTNVTRVGYVLTVTTPGASGTAKVSITPDSTADTAQTNVTVTTATPVTVGALGLTLTPTFTGSLVAGQTWKVVIYPPSITYAPVSASLESCTMQMYLDGTLHTLTGAVGTFQITATSGDMATIAWTFTGQYNATVDSALPTPTYETTLPAMVQNSTLLLDSSLLKISKFTADIANTVQPREDANSPDGYAGVYVVDRKPKGGIDPEASLVANEDFWGKLTAAQVMYFQMKVGSTAGNTVWIEAPGAQYTGLTYKDRNGFRTYDAALAFSAYAGAGGDELLLTFA